MIGLLLIIGVTLAVAGQMKKNDLVRNIGIGLMGGGIVMLAGVLGQLNAY